MRAGPGGGQRCQFSFAVCFSWRCSYSSAVIHAAGEGGATSWISVWEFSFGLLPISFNLAGVEFGSKEILLVWQLKGALH